MLAFNRGPVFLVGLLLCALLIPKEVAGGPFAGGICSAGCAAVVCACYSAAGAVFGTITAGVGTAPAILACNKAFGICMMKCAMATAAPTP